MYCMYMYNTCPSQCTYMYMYIHVHVHVLYMLPVPFRLFLQSDMGIDQGEADISVCRTGCKEL